MRLFSAATIEAAKRNQIASRSATAGWQNVQKRVAAWNHGSVLVPAEAGGWIHNYICPDHWQPLVYDGNLPDVHACPEGHVCSGEKYDAAWRVWRHRQIADLAREAALAYVVLGFEDGRVSAESILLQYADFYTQLDGKADAEAWMLQGHAFNQALTEALWAIPLIHAYDLIAETLTVNQRSRLARDLWQPLAAIMVTAQDKLIAQNHIESNYMAWLNVTLGCLGFALNDQALIDRALQPPAGFASHLEKSVLADGLEYEGTPYYHNFVLLANLILAEAASANGIDLYAVSGSVGQSLFGMGQAFAQLAWPDGTIPDMADGSYWQNSIYDPEICQTYEILKAHYPDPQFVRTLSAAYARQGVGRDNWAALLYGYGELVSAESPPITNTFFKESGFAILRSDKLAALVSYGPYRKQHHQADRLSLTVWPFSRDAGSPLYGLEARKTWYPHSYAHNTLVVDGQSHADCGGELLDLSERCVCVSAPDAYLGVDMTRTVEMMRDNAIADELDVQSDSEHTFDWVFHIDGDCSLPDDLQPLTGSLAEDGPAAYIELLGQKSVDDTVSFDIEFDSQAYRLRLRGERPFTLLIGSVPGTTRHPEQKRQVLIGRTVGTYQRYQTHITHIQ
jgi:hypothetical protein